MLIKTIIKLNVACVAAFRATFGPRIAALWSDRYIRQYVFISLHRPYSYWMLSGEDNNSKWLPSGTGLLANTGLIKWSGRPWSEPESDTAFAPRRTNRIFTHPNVNLVANFHPDHRESQMSDAQVLARFQDIQSSNEPDVEEIVINIQDEKDFLTYSEFVIAEIKEDKDESVVGETSQESKDESVVMICKND